MYWEPVATPSSHLEPPEVKPWLCGVCDRGEDYCTCSQCEACLDRNSEVKVVRSGDEMLTLCKACADAD